MESTQTAKEKVRQLIREVLTEDDAPQFDENRFLERVTKMTEHNMTRSPPPGDAPNSAGLWGMGLQSNNVRVKNASERWDGSKKALCWPDTPQKKHLDIAGKPATLYENTTGVRGAGQERTFDTLSQRDLAKCGAWTKHQMGFPLNQHEKDLLLETLHKDRWVGMDHERSAYARTLTNDEIHTILTKTVLNESGSSGGGQAVPEYFDSAAIQTPLLHGELFPHVEVIPVPHGAAVASYKIGTPTFVSTASGSAITPFSTTSFVSAFDTNIFPASCFVEVGNDFLADAAPDFAQRVINQIGAEHLRWLEEQIAVGDGTTEPQGIFTGTTTTVSPESSHTFSSFNYSDVLNVAFGIDKAHRNNWGGNSTRFVMNDSQYKEFMQIVTGVTGDTRPIFGMKIKDYMLGDYPVSVQNNISNGNLALCNLRGYRLYRRQGLQFYRVTEGRTLALANTTMLGARMRWGGQLTLSTYAAEMTA